MTSIKKTGLPALCMVALFMTGCSTLDTASGTYIGTVYSAGPVPVFTTFYPRPLDEQKQMYGTFMYSENDDWVTGSLSHCRSLPERRMVCHWHDKYGVGIMDVHFDENHQSFDGHWGTFCGTTRPDMIWNGKRVQAHPGNAQ